MKLWCTYRVGDGRVFAVHAAQEVTWDPPPGQAIGEVLSGWPIPAGVGDAVFCEGVISRTDLRTAAQAWSDVRAKRDSLLATTDKHWIRAHELAGQVLAAWPNGAWAAYRQALRDITNQADPFNITWPTPPNA